MDKNQDYHVHCNYNDHSASDLTVKNIIAQAEKIGLRVIAITEHVRRTSDWIPRYLAEIRAETAAAASSNKLKLIAGFEAKILRDGSIDCCEEYSKDNFIVASFHTIFGDKRIWIEALRNAIQNPDVDVIGHLAPEPTFDLNDKELSELASLIFSNHKIIELNAKYHRPPPRWLLKFKEHQVRFHLGSDAHSLEEIGNFSRISDLIAMVEDDSRNSSYNSSSWYLSEH
ncbi:MAG: PHP domain-containing protein [Thermoproteota archaeon]|nr:PHP domain-containing protein [Thermoproteota archaeon]